jgi:hypothetical protein
VVFGDSMPDQLNLVDSTCGSLSAFCTVDSLPSGASATMTIIGTPIPNLARSERRISNTAFVAGAASIDPNPSNDSASALVRVVGPLRPPENPPRISIDPVGIDFGPQPVGSEVLKAATITNLGSSDVILLVEAALPDDFGFGLLPGSTCPALAPGGVLSHHASCDVVVRFTPTEFFAGQRQTGALTVSVHDIATREVVATKLIPVSGTGTLV